jgi:hypothetical protein
MRDVPVCAMAVSAVITAIKHGARKRNVFFIVMPPISKRNPLLWLAIEPCHDAVWTKRERMN